MRLIRAVVVSTLVCLVVSACQAGSLGEVNPSGTASPSAAAMSPQASDMASASAMEAGTQAMVALASQRLAERLDIGMEEISLVRVRRVDWRDASLGCPKPSVDYMRSVTPGYAIWLEAAGNEYEYHTNDADRVIPCETGKE